MEQNQTRVNGLDESIQPPEPWLWMQELTSGIHLWELNRDWTKLQTLPAGDGHAVMVLPGFMTSDLVTLPIRRLLTLRGYQANGWAAGLNTGFHHERLDVLVERLHHLFDRSGQTVSLVGWSLGGIYARELARLHPDLVRLVVTLGSPFSRNPAASNVRGFYEWISGNRAAEIDEAFLASIQPPPPVPTTAIFTKEDGIVAWQATVETHTGPMCENIEVRSTHCGLGYHPPALVALLDRLAKPQGQWQPFRPDHYPDWFPKSKRSWQDRVHQLDQALTALDEWSIKS